MVDEDCGPTAHHVRFLQALNGVNTTDEHGAGNACARNPIDSMHAAAELLQAIPSSPWLVGEKNVALLSRCDVPC